MTRSTEAAFVHQSAVVEDGAILGEGTRVWHNAQIRTRACIGARCIIGKGVFVDFDVVVGDDCKLQNYVCVYHGVRLGRGVFVGPHAVFTNDVFPRATDRSFAALKDGDWDVGQTVVEDGASIGANSTILPNLRIGKWSMVAAGSIVSRSVQAYSLVRGTPARHAAYLCPCGRKVSGPECERCGTLPSDHPLKQ